METIPQSPPSWQRSLARAVRDPKELACRLGLSAIAPDLGGVGDDFPLLVTESYIARMRHRDPADPLLLQVLPSARELTSGPAYVDDPVGDLASRKAPGLLHKYTGRALLIVTGACAIHCRYCFRRHYPYSDDPRSLREVEPALDAIADDDSIREIILSGGDPLTRTDPWLSELVDRLAAIPHLETLRVHTRLPIVLPERVTEELVDWLNGSGLQPVLVLHANHAAELVGDCADAISRLRREGIQLLNQAVLLHGVNDNVDGLENLSRRLWSLGVIPYYLHQLDRVKGASHFEVDIAAGVELMRELRCRLPGYLVPRYVREVAGAPHKVEVAQPRR